VPQIRGKMVHFPGKNGENGGKINISSGKVPGICRNTVHFPPIGRTRNAGRRATEAIVLFRSRGKCLGFAAKWFTFPGRTDQEWAFRIRISERSGSPGADNFVTN